MFSIGDLSRLTGVKVPTIRYYEQIGLVEPDGRTAGNQRRYGPEGLERLTFIRHGRDLGLPLERIRALLALDPKDHASTHRIAEDQLDDVRDRIARLKALERELIRISKSCTGEGEAECSVLRAFGSHEDCAGPH
ncbi:helix-turn-helix domain-containing protein [Alisedimentitalea sp. MJ-SS2]|uniref:MerR family transcriptional regulator n=1 Tax=Aliisedimentitalea sp. MJ-SS2 TaxID=3049795 RepID=UPI002915AD3E|nr:helix-turn-helix domain-containing protein [Alisedimentitalea sp. MJ-SS2]MDU8929338.1 helix-turn-helix domain-containing protein [Alisedimentitalea sp. MJ-SS2]